MNKKAKLRHENYTYWNHVCHFLLYMECALLPFVDAAAGQF